MARWSIWQVQNSTVSHVIMFRVLTTHTVNGVLKSRKLAMIRVHYYYESCGFVFVTKLFRTVYAFHIRLLFYH